MQTVDGSLYIRDRTTNVNMQIVLLHRPNANQENSSRIKADRNKNGVRFMPSVESCSQEGCCRSGSSCALRQGIEREG